MHHWNIRLQHERISVAYHQRQSLLSFSTDQKNNSIEYSQEAIKGIRDVMTSIIFFLFSEKEKRYTFNGHANKYVPAT